MFRHRLFGVREKLMLMVADGRLDSEDISYSFLRMAINGMIHKAEHFNLLTLVFFTAADGPPFDTPINRWKDATKKLPSETQNELNALQADISQAFGIYLISGSVIMMGVVSFIMLKQLFESAFKTRIHVRVAVELAAESARFRRYENAAYKTAAFDCALAPA
jgi:hypothetical protein